jgi:putative redox protein
MPTTLARIHRESGALTTITNGRHSWTSDVPKTHGSADAGPDPHDLYDSALAACTVLTLELYLRRKDWKADTISCEVDRISETKGDDGKIVYQLRRRIHVTGQLSAEERSRLIEIANKCPIHKLMEGRTEVETVLEE